MFDDIGNIPEPIAALANLHEKRAVALANTYCRMYHPDRYSYHHIEGNISIGPRPDDFSGMVGILYSNEQLLTAPLRSEHVDRSRVAQALHTFLQINPLFQEYLPNAATLYGYFDSPSIGALPMIDNSQVITVLKWNLNEIVILNC
jgi:hypothetical protein